MITICVTGHRPDNENLGGYDIFSPRNKQIAKELLSKIENIIMENPKEKDFHLISGMALGIDTMFFMVGYKMKNTYKKLNITLEAAVPFKDQSIKWFDKLSIDRHNIMLKKSDKVTYVDRLEEYKLKGYQEDIYYAAKMQKRNKYMVDKSNYIIAVWDGTKKGGTYNCYKYALKQDINIVRVNPKEII